MPYCLFCLLDMTRKQNNISIRACQVALGPDMCKCLLFAHAVSGCDTTSAIFSIGKVKHLNALKSSKKTRNSIRVFGEDSSSKEEVVSAGEKYVASFYKGGNKTSSLNELRYLLPV